jgi:hypothetical protein
VKDDAAAKLEQTKASIASSYESAKNSAVEKYDDAKKATHDTAKSVENTASSWWSWGSKKADETKSDAAGKVAEGADKVKYEAQKRQ